MDMKTGPSFCCIQETHLNWKTHPQSKWLGKIFQWNVPKKQASVSILISKKLDFKLKINQRDKQVYFTGKIHQDKVSVLNIYDPNTKAPNS